jgi:hypothetical protein
MVRARSTLAAAGVLVIAIVALTWWPRSGTGDAETPLAVQPPETMRATPAPVPVVVPLTAVDVRRHAATVDRTTMLELPDGTFVPALNQTVGAPPLAIAWQGPWSPIDHVERTDQGVDWYVHRDGTRSTTEMKYRPELGRMDAMTRTGRPGGDPPSVTPVH